MLNERRSRIGRRLFAVGLLGIASAAGGVIVQHLQPHVEVSISNVDGTVQVAVECEQAVEVVTGEARALDLGRMPPDTRVFVSVLSSNQHPAWSIELRSNGTSFFDDSQGHAKTPLAPQTAADEIVFAQAFTAGGDELGSIGCQDTEVISESDVPQYVPSPDEKKSEVVGEEKSPFRPQSFPYDLIDAAGRWALVLLGVSGAALAIAIWPTRRLIQMHWKWALGALASLATVAGLFLGVLGAAALVTALTVGGTLLFFAVAVLLMRPPLWERLKRATGPERAER